MIRSAALEAGIGQASVDRALEEYAAGRTGDFAPHVRSNTVDAEGSRGARWRRWRRKLVTGLRFAVPTFVLAVLISEGGEGTGPLIVLGWMALVGVAARLAWKRRPTGRARGYLLRVGLMFFAALFGFAAAGGDEDVVALLLATAIALVVLGPLAIKVGGAVARQRRELPELTS